MQQPTIPPTTEILLRVLSDVVGGYKYDTSYGTDYYYIRMLMVPLPAMLLLNPFPTHPPTEPCTLLPAPLLWPHYHSPTRPIMMMMPLFQPLTFPTSRPPASIHLSVVLSSSGWLALMSIKIIMCSCWRTEPNYYYYYY